MPLRVQSTLPSLSTISTDTVICTSRLVTVTWLVLLLPWYLAEALVRALTESGRHAIVAAAAAVLAAAAFGAAMAWFRAEKRARRS